MNVLVRRCADAATHVASLLWAHRWLALAVIVVVGLGGWQGARLWFGPGVVVDIAKRGALVETVVAMGNVEMLYRRGAGYFCGVIRSSAWK